MLTRNGKKRPGNTMVNTDSTLNKTMQNVLLLSRAYRQFIIELGQAFKELQDTGGYEGFADTFIDAIKSPEVGFTKSEVDTLVKISTLFGLLGVDDLPSHHCMKLMVNKKVDMDLLEAANTLSLTDFKELIKDHEIGIHHSSLVKRLKKWSLKEALTTKKYEV